MPISFTWLGQGGFLFEADHTRLLVDPYLSDCIERLEGFRRLHPFPLPLETLHPDFLLVTHDHLDHLDPEGIPILHKLSPKCQYVGTARSYEHFRQLGLPPSQCHLLATGESLSLGAFQVTAVFAKHSEPTACGYLLAVSEQRIYLTGDTFLEEGLFSPDTKGCDLLLICINGRLGNMTLQEALHCVETLRPKLAIPMHFGLFAENTADPTPFVAGCHALGIPSFVPQRGVPFPLSE